MNQQHGVLEGGAALGGQASTQAAKTQAGRQPVPLALLHLAALYLTRSAARSVGASGCDASNCAEQLIALHGSWAQHVALTAAAQRAVENDRDGERFWCDVLAAVLDVQTRAIEVPG